MAVADCSSSSRIHSCTTTCAACLAVRVQESRRAPRKKNENDTGDAALITRMAEVRIPRKDFVGMLLAGAAFLAPLERIARAQSPAGRATKAMIIRHAEKPVGKINGIDESGNQDANSLIPQGWQRAGALVSLFGSSFGPLPTPTHLFAPNLFGSGSKRPFETLTPLAAKLGITMNATPDGVAPGQYAPTDYPAMISDALACPGVALVAWEHEFIPSIANVILGNSTTVPQVWPSARFDIVWTFDLDPITGTYTWNQLPQLLLQGDLSSPIPSVAA
jgi:hypothetical protein